uniref:Uncharacterized protein n=1 Tax=Rhizophora mucronata TaxID=61149 RepID=A0A2P2Q306_RHIMU
MSCPLASLISSSLLIKAPSNSTKKFGVVRLRSTARLQIMKKRRLGGLERPCTEE